MKTKLWKLFLRMLRAATWAVDGWIQRQEEKLREAPARAAALAEVDPVASAAREKARSQELTFDGAVTAHRRVRTGRAARSLSGQRGTKRAQSTPRLRYRGGEFVREA